MSDEPTSGTTVAVLRLATAGLVAGVLGLTGCGGSASGESRSPSSDRSAGDPGAVVRGVADALRRSGTSKTRTTMEMVNGDTRVTIRGTGVFDYGRESGRLKVTLPEGAGRSRDPITELVVPGALYMRNRVPEIPDGKWVRVSTARLADGNLVTGGATDPITAADLLRGAQDVERAGSETLDGERVLHYRGTADMERAAGAAPKASADALRAASKSFTVTRVPFDVYIDERGRLRKVRQEFTFRSASGPGSTRDRVRVVSTIELYDFGGPVRIKVPESADIYHGKIVSPAASGGPGTAG